LKYAATLGYKFEILEGVTFDQDIIFDSFINTLYEQRLKYPKSDPRNLIGKLSMNTGYGRYGMSPYIELYSILSKENLGDSVNYLDSIDLGDKEIVSFRKIKNDKNNDFMMNISTSIASAVTAYARIEINKLKIKFVDHLLYSDTDSLFLDIPLSDDLINNKLGGLKLEYILKEAVFLGPKVYAGIFEDGTEFSKVKGYTKPVNFSELSKLLIKDKSLELKHEKWFRSFSYGKITVKDTLYNLVINANKRKIIYRRNKFIGTKPIRLKS
jgi:DNA polymerase elongation subunit (family B)